MAACSAGDDAQEWELRSSPLIPGAHMIQSVVDPTACIVGTGHIVSAGVGVR